MSFAISPPRHSVPVPAVHNPLRFLRPIRECFSERARGIRTITVLIAVALLSLGDLYMTLAFATSVGMIENNPIARAVMAIGHPNLLIYWKLATVGATTLLIFRCRRSRVGELGGWLCLAILLWLTLRWQTYSDAMPELTRHLPKIANVESERWVVIGQSR